MDKKRIMELAGVEYTDNSTLLVENDSGSNYVVLDYSHLKPKTQEFMGETIGDANCLLDRANKKIVCLKSDEEMFRNTIAAEAEYESEDDLD